MRVRETDAGRLYEEAETFGVHRLDRGRGFGLLAEDGGGFVARQNRLVWRSVRQADAALKPVPKGADGLQNHRLGEVARQVDASADGKLLVRHSCLSTAHSGLIPLV